MNENDLSNIPRWILGMLKYVKHVCNIMIEYE